MYLCVLKLYIILYNTAKYNITQNYFIFYCRQVPINCFFRKKNIYKINNAIAYISYIGTIILQELIFIQIIL